MGHLALLGDSTFANLAHVGPPELIDQLRERLPAGWEATLAAVDGARVADVHRQLAAVPPETTHLALSVGGNDAIALTAALRAPAPNLGSALAFVDRHRRAFAVGYRRLLAHLAALGHPIVVCTVYEPRLEPPARQRAVESLVALLNDSIVAAAAEHGATVLDLRPLSADAANFVSPIELAHQGAGRLADALVRVADGGAMDGGSRLVAAWPPP
jgi:hypothetical protein